MSDRKLRKSTQEATEKTKNRLEARKSVRELKQQRSTYSELIANQERELSELADASDTQGASVDSHEGSDEVFDFEENSSAEEYLDPLKAVRSPPPQVPLRSEVTKVRSTPSPGSWSTSINTFFPEGCVLTPRILPPLPSSGSAVLPPVGLESISEVSNEEQELNKSIAMDDQAFNPLMISIRREIFSVEQKIKCFTTAHVSLDLKEEIPARLEKIDD